MKKYLPIVVVLLFVLSFSGCSNASVDHNITGSSNSASEDKQQSQSTPPSSSQEGAILSENKIDGKAIDVNIEEISNDGIVEKLVSFGLSEEEAYSNREILLLCGIENIDICEPTDSNSTVDGLVCFRGEIDKDRVFWFTVENRKIFYVSLNGNDLYDSDKGGFIQRIDDVHIPETYMPESRKQALIELAEATLDKYFLYNTRYYDAWGVGREDDKYMVRCEVSDGSILTSNWTQAYVWFEEQNDEFSVTGVKINGKFYEVK